MALPFYVSPEQIMHDKAEYARKGIAKGRSSIIMEYNKGILLLADNPSSSLHKISEIYDNIAFAAAGKYSEFENLRKAGIRHADVKGYSYSRDDVTAMALANNYSQLLGTIFSQETKPMEVEILIASVGKECEIYRISFDGNIIDEKGFSVVGGDEKPISNYLKEHYNNTNSLEEAIKLSVAGFKVKHPDISVETLEAGILDRDKPGRKFRRITKKELEQIVK